LPRGGSLNLCSGKKCSRLGVGGCDKGDDGSGRDRNIPLDRSWNPRVAT
jgi:hypothetical protein